MSLTDIVARLLVLDKGRLVTRWRTNGVLAAADKLAMGDVDELVAGGVMAAADVFTWTSCPTNIVIH